MVGGSWGLLRRPLSVMIALALAATALIIGPRPVAAATAVPWRFATVTDKTSIAGAATGDGFVKGWVETCPTGYLAVSGGFVQVDASPPDIHTSLSYPDPGTGSWHIVAWNGAASGTNLTIVVNCVWADNVGTIQLVENDFGINAHQAGGETYCPANTYVLSAGVDWSNTDELREIQFSAPLATDGTHADAWYVAGDDPTAGSLHVELQCVAASLLTGEFITANDGGSAGPGYRSVPAQCSTGFRILTGGAIPTSASPGNNQGYAAISGPIDPRNWPVTGYAQTGVTLRAMAVCLPASTIAFSFLSVPPKLSTARSGSITFQGVDSAGETVKYSCLLDLQTVDCTSGSVGYGPLLDGSHTLQVSAQNQSGTISGGVYQWTIDATAPTVISHSPTSQLPLKGPITITFSEAVYGVGVNSVTVHAQSANVDVPGKTARPSSSTATWTPSAPLVPGETYRVSISSAVHDLAGNHLVATFFTVRATTTVENSSPAMHEYWDLDNNAIASGGAYITSRVSVSRADLTFTATAGQTVSLYGIRLPSGGYADVYLDGIKVATPSFYAASAARVRVYLSGALTAGSHTISIRPLGTKPTSSSGAWVSVDDLAIGATVKQESALTQHFRRVTSSSAYGGSYDLMVHTTDSDGAPRFQATVVGTGVKVYVTKTATSGKAQVYVDGVLKATVDCHASSTTYKALVYSGTFALGQHTIKVVAVGTSSGSTSDVNLDRLTVT